MDEKKAGTVDMDKQAVALSYDEDAETPRILAAGKGYLAQKIIDKANAADIPLYQDEKLARTLSKLEIGDMIPAELYEVVAEILVFVDRMDRLRNKMNDKEQ